VVVVLARIVVGDHTELIVAPVTHSPPFDQADAVQFPARDKKQIGLDGEPSWIVVAEVNRFVWPGPDIRTAKGQETPLYGALPAKLFRQIQQAISDHVDTSRLKLTPRTE